MVRPLRTSRRRGPATGVSTVRTSASYPAAAGPRDEVAARLPVAPQVELEPPPCRRAPRPRAARSRWCPSWTARRGSRSRGRHPRDRRLALGVHHPGEAGGGEDERQRRRPPEDRRRRVHVGDVPQHPGLELDPARTPAGTGAGRAPRRRRRRCSRTPPEAPAAGPAAAGRRSTRRRPAGARSGRAARRVGRSSGCSSDQRGQLSGGHPRVLHDRPGRRQVPRIRAGSLSVAPTGGRRQHGVEGSCAIGPSVR